MSYIIIVTFLLNLHHVFLLWVSMTGVIVWVSPGLYGDEHGNIDSKLYVDAPLHLSLMMRLNIVPSFWLFQFVFFLIDIICLSHIWYCCLWYHVVWVHPIPNRVHLCSVHQKVGCHPQVLIQWEEFVPCVLLGFHWGFLFIFWPHDIAIKIFY